ncbi:unnamed protein product [Symbiodinium sp. CCMP2456]|nr:unnamed protein product [Symbiodinium sp. CCMP2456]
MIRTKFPSEYKAAETKANKSGVEMIQQPVFREFAVDAQVHFGLGEPCYQLGYQKRCLGGRFNQGHMPMNAMALVMFGEFCWVRRILWWEPLVPPTSPSCRGAAPRLCGPATWRSMVALEEVGPAADFGSLSAFLGVGVPSVPGVPVAERGAHLKAPLPLPTPTATSARIGKDGTLSKKVAFRMLKQLGCEVLSDEDGEARYVQVGIKSQPVLFKMLVELGHVPRRGEDGEFMVQVVEQRGRKPEEVVAALSAPRKPPRAPRQEPEDEGYPSMPRPRLKPEDAQLLVNRLYKVPRRPPAEVKADAAKPRRTAAEQRAYLDRLVKPRAEETQLAPELDEVIVEAGRRLLKNGITWPSFSSPSESRAKKAQSRTRLAQAGALAISSTEPKEDLRGPRDSLHSRLRLPRSRPSSAELRRRDSAAAATPLQPLALKALDSLESAPPKSPAPESPPPAPAEQEVSAEGLEQEETPRPEAPEAQAREAPEAETAKEEMLEEEPEVVLEESMDLEAVVESTGAWLERLLGPAKFGIDQKRSCKEQQRRLEELAKPRQVKEPGPEPAAKPTRPRSPRSQREACKRLAQPRKPKAEEPPSADQAAHAQGEEEELETQGQDQEPGGPSVSDPLEEALEEVPVKIIPSLLAQCPSRLERIDEEAKEARAQAKRESLRARSRGRGHRSPGRTRSQGASLRGAPAPYAVPVVPKHLVDGPPRPEHTKGKDPKGEKRRRTSGPGANGPNGPSSASGADSPEEELSPEEAAKLLSFLGEEGVSEGHGEGSAACEQMLHSIDALYTQFMAATSDTGVMPDGNSSEAQAEGDLETLEGTDEPSGASETQLPQPREGEDLLADIDRLYWEMLDARHGDSPDEDSMPAEETSKPAEPTVSAPLPFPLEVPQAPETRPQAETDTEELPALLEEVLWSAILLTRGAAGRKLESGIAEARLLQLLPPARLAQAASLVALPNSLLQRLASELPEVCAALKVTEDLCPPGTEQRVTLFHAVREARDRLLDSAASESVAGASSRPSSGRPLPDCPKPGKSQPTACLSTAAYCSGFPRSMSRHII